MLKDVIPAAWRKFFYTVYAIVAFVVGALQVGGVEIGTAAKVLVYVGTGIGAVAAGNTVVEQLPAARRRDEAGTADTVLLLVVVILVIVTLLWFGVRPR